MNIAECFEQSMIHTAFRYVTWLTQLKFPSHWYRYHVEKCIQINKTFIHENFKVSEPLTGTCDNITIAKTLVILNTVWEKNVATLVNNVQYKSISRQICNFCAVLPLLGLQIIETILVFFVCVFLYLIPRLEHNNTKRIYYEAHRITRKHNL